MLDANPLYPKGFLTANPSYDRSGLTRAVPRCRYEVSSVKYYVIDFGLSTLFDDSAKSRLVTGGRAQDGDIPELSNTVPYDPFLVDVFTLGNLFKQTFIQVRPQAFCPINANERLEILEFIISERTCRENDKFGSEISSEC